MHLRYYLLHIHHCMHCVIVSLTPPYPRNFKDFKRNKKVNDCSQGIRKTDTIIFLSLLDTEIHLILIMREHVGKV